jgi:hypothetical protein
MRAVPPEPLPYRDFYYPLNVFMHMLTREEGAVTYLHYGLFEHPDDSIAVAQERSTEMLLTRLPPPPARLLEVGVGLGTTLRRLASMGYDAEGITPDEHQVAMVRERHDNALRVHCAAFESFAPRITYDALIFQESSQYIEAETLFARAATLAPLVVVLDEFALQPVDGLHRLDLFLEAASHYGYAIDEELDLSAQAAPTPRYFSERFERYRPELIEALGLTSQQVDDLVESAGRYIERYRDGVYGYRLLRLVTA